MITIPDNIKQNHLKRDDFGLHWQAILESLIANGKAAGADFIEIFLESTDHVGVLAEQDNEYFESTSPINNLETYIL